MGNCFERCCGKLDKRKYLRTRYNVERDFSIEFENLMDDETQQEEMTKVVTARERHLVKDKNFTALLEEQKRIDVEIDDELVRQEEELRQEEEAYYEAKREAARAAKASKQLALKAAAQSSGTGTATAPNAWLADENDWDMADEGDFEMFLESVKARSLAARTRVLASQVPIDAQSTSSSTQMSKGEQGEQTHTEASSIDLEWEHEAGMQPLMKGQSSPTEDSLEVLGVKLAMLNQRQQQAGNNPTDPTNGNTLTHTTNTNNSTTTTGTGGVLPAPTTTGMFLSNNRNHHYTDTDLEWDNDDMTAGDQSKTPLLSRDKTTDDECDR